MADTSRAGVEQKPEARGQQHIEMTMPKSNNVKQRPVDDISKNRTVSEQPGCQAEVSTPTLGTGLSPCAGTESATARQAHPNPWADPPLAAARLFPTAHSCCTRGWICLMKWQSTVC